MTRYIGKKTTIASTNNSDTFAAVDVQRKVQYVFASNTFNFKTDFQKRMLRQLKDPDTRNDAAHHPKEVLMANVARMDKRAIQKKINRSGFVNILNAIYNRIEQ